MAAFGAAVDLGYRYVETDVHATQDGELLAFHDSSLDGVTDRTGELAAMPWREVRRARIGGVEPIARFEDLAASWPQLRLNVDVKAPGAVAPLAQAIERLGLHERICVASFSDRRRHAVLRRLSRPVTTSAGSTVGAMFLLGLALRSPALRRAALGGIGCVQSPVLLRGRPLVTARTLAAVHEAGAQLHVWTVDDPTQMHALLDLGVDGLLTDRADLLRQVLLDRGQWT